MAMPILKSAFTRTYTLLYNIKIKSIQIPKNVGICIIIFLNFKSMYVG